MITIMITLALIFIALMSVIISTSISYNNNLKNRKNEINNYKSKHAI